MNYLKDKTYYEDIYDRHTVEECRDMDKRFRGYDKPLSSKAGKTLSPKEQKALTKLTTDVSLYYLTGERYLQKEETVKAWMERDQNRDDTLASAIEPDAVCKKCNIEMEYIFKELRDLDKADRVLFFFTCPSCKGHRAIFDNGEEYKPKTQLCPHCETELTVHSTRKDNKIISEYRCSHCKFKKKETLNLNVKTPKEKPDPNFEKDKARFCFTEKEGLDYMQGKSNLKQLTAMREEAEERKKHKDLYDAVEKIKKLTVQDLQKQLAPILQRNNYAELKFAQPRIERRVTVGFTVQDYQSGREEYDSKKQLEKIIKKSLKEVNWNLMSDGVDYRLGILKGSLRAYESEEDLVKLVQSRNKKETMTDKDLNKIIKTLTEVLDNKVTWALFGSAAIAAHHGGMYRKIDDIDVIVDSDDDTITNLFKEKSFNIEIKDRRGRHRGYLKINDVSIELMFMSAKNTIDIPGGKYIFEKIEQLMINDIKVPVVDSLSLLKAKEQYKAFLENKKKTEGLASGEKEKLSNTYLDIKKIKKKSMFTSENFKRIAGLVYRSYYKYLFEHAVRLLRYTRLPYIRKNNLWIGAMQRNMVKYRVRFEDAVRQGKSAVPENDNQRKLLDIRLKTNNEFLRVLKDIGDGIAWRNLDYQRPLIRLMSEHAPTGPLGQDAQRMLLLLGARKKLSDRVIINDLSHCLKTADLTVVTSKGKIYLYEVKARKDKTEIIDFMEISKRVQKYKQIRKQAITQWIVQMAFIDQKIQTPNKEIKIVNLDFKFGTHIKKIKQLISQADKNIFAKTLLEEGYHIEVCALDKAFEKLSEDEFKKKFSDHQPFDPSVEGWSDMTLPISNYDTFYSTINKRFQNFTPYSVLPFSAKNCVRLMMGQLYIRICFDFMKLKEKFENAGWSVEVRDWEAIAEKNKEVIKIIDEGKGGFLENMVDEAIFKISKKDDEGKYTQEFSINVVTIMLSSFYSTEYLIEMIEAAYQSAKIHDRSGGLSTFSNQFEKHILR